MKRILETIILSAMVLAFAQCRKNPLVGKYSRIRPNGTTETVEEIIELRDDGMWELRNIFSEQKKLGRLAEFWNL